MTIPVSIELHHVKVAKRLLEYIERKLSKLDHFLSDIESVTVELSLRAGVRSLSERKVAQITVHARGTLLRAEETSDDLRTAVDRAIEKVHRQVEHYKGKHTARRSVRGGLLRMSALLAEAPEVDGDDEAAVDDIMRRKSFKISLMSEYEAVDQMLLLGHTFFVFLHADTSRVNVVYRRKGGGYGLILPELA
jgi:putative sigma-54 modulation protein